MSYHPAVPTATGEEKENSGKILDAEDASRLARLAYRVVLQREEKIDGSHVIRQMKSVAAKEIAKAVLGKAGVDDDAQQMAKMFKDWARRNARIQPEAE